MFVYLLLKSLVCTLHLLCLFVFMCSLSVYLQSITTEEREDFHQMVCPLLLFSLRLTSFELVLV